MWKSTLFAVALAAGMGAEEQPAPANSLAIPRLDRPPALEDFLGVRPAGALEGRMARVDGLIQRQPRDGAPASQHTEVYLGYDEEKLYVVFVCFDSEPDKIRARLVKREQIPGDDMVEIYLDTFRDERRAYVFAANPLGIQADAMWSEAQGELDDSFDTYWESSGRLTDAGYVVLMAIPFQSLRFPTAHVQSWGVLLDRIIPRVDEWSSWPHATARIDGLMNQAAGLTGLEDVTGGRNIRVIPYASFRAYRSLDTRDVAAVRFVEDAADPRLGLDAKYVFRDALVLDLTLNPDFAQVESDEPQSTVNRRFEVYFPEKRPFFLENADLFRTPIDLVFTRRIADPLLGLRLTGKLGPYSLAALVADDRAPGLTVPEHDPRAGAHAWFGVLRANRDILTQSNLGLIYTQRALEGGINRVAGLDGRFKLNDNWSADLQAVWSSTREPEGARRDGTARKLRLERNGRHLEYWLDFWDISPGFSSLAGFVPRTDVRQATQLIAYSFRPERTLISWQPGFWCDLVWDHDGSWLERTYNPFIFFNFTGQSYFAVGWMASRERLRPEDYPALPEPREYGYDYLILSGGSEALSQLTTSVMLYAGSALNYVPPAGSEPYVARWLYGSFRAELKPTSSIRIDNRYIFSRLAERRTGGEIFTQHILRSGWYWQATRELSFRLIAQYETLMADATRTRLEPSKRLNADFLLAYQLNPWTALYAGVASSYQSLDLIAGEGLENSLLRSGGRLVNDSRQLFIKYSQLLRL